MTINKPWTKTEDLVSDPDRRERWIWERLEKEWPEGPPEIVKAIVWASLSYSEEAHSIAISLDEISTTLKEILIHMQRD